MKHSINFGAKTAIKINEKKIKLFHHIAFGLRLNTTRRKLSYFSLNYLISNTNGVHGTNVLQYGFLVRIACSECLLYRECPVYTKLLTIGGVSSSTFKGWTDGHWKDVLTSLSVASTEADRKRFRKPENPEVAKKLIMYLERRRFLYEQDKCGISWLIPGVAL